MTVENKSLLFAKIGFLAVLTMLIMIAGNYSNQHTQAQTMNMSGH